MCSFDSVTRYALPAQGAKMVGGVPCDGFIQSARGNTPRADFKGCPHFPSNTLIGLGQDHERKVERDVTQSFPYS